MAGASVARAGASSRGAGSIDEMIMQRPGKAAAVLADDTAAVLSRQVGLQVWCGERPHQVRLSIIEFGRVLRCLEDFRIVPVEDLRIFGIADQPDTLIAA